LRAAADAERTTVIHIRTSPDDRLPGYESWWDVPIAEESAEVGVRAARAAYEEAKERQRVLV
jgi:3D-(3,5/4)-trihydroxycyclohexane-1,2-dione acylhydrolase (decyclizing)